MNPNIRLLSLCVMICVGVAAAGQDSATKRMKVEGVITQSDAQSFKLRPTAGGNEMEVKFSSATAIREKKSNPFRGARKYQASDLAPGLTVQVEARGDSSGNLIADRIRFTDNDFKVARTVETRVTPVEQNTRKMTGQIAELDAVSNAARGGASAAQETADRAHERIGSLDDYTPVANTTVRFKVGSAQLSDEAKAALDKIAEQAKNQRGYVIEVSGFASSEGKSELNRRLSRQRSQAVAEYLAEQHDIPLRRIMTPSGYGATHPVADNTTRTGRQENRRAEIRLLISRGLSASSGNPSTSEPVPLRNPIQQ